ncbi:MAG: InlB B-repeat-containing protein, partial [Clostridia bacterium]|nr:InlB B-repeat-containing protein [Clostridia bacterium]
FYARVEIITYSIDYVLPSGSTLDGTETIEYNIETGVTLPTATNISVPTGYEFLGWYDNAELTGNVVTEIPVGTMGNKTYYASVKPILYSIDYVLPAGSALDGSQTTQYKVTMGVILPTSSAITTPLGYEFLGWYENPEFSGNAVTEIEIGTTGNKTYYGKVETITYSIDYVLPSGSTLDGTEATEYNIETAVTLPAYSTVSLPAGYVFGGWFEDAQCQGQEVTEIPVGTMGNKTYYGKVTPIPYSISYVLPQGTTFNSAPVDSYNVETAVTLPTDTALTTPLGYEFKGWYENQEYTGSAVTSISTGNTGDKTFYALVKPIQYSIRYELPTGSSLNITPTTSYNITESVTLPVTENVTVPLGYEFLGWYDNDQYTGAPVTNIEVGTTGNKTFYAKVGPIPYFIYYSFPDGGSFIDPDDYVGTYTIEQMVTLPTGGVMILPRGYKFDGWKEVPVQTGMQMRLMRLANFMSEDELVTTIEKGTTGHKAYEAQISLIEYEIKYHYPNGTALDGNETTIFTILDTVTLPTELQNVPFGYEFRGWYENDQYTGSKVTGFVAEQLADSELKDKEYYAWVAPEEYDIEYVMPTVPAGVTLDGSETKKYTIETAVTLPGAENVRMPKGYKFEGWFENPEFTGTAVTGFDKGQTGKKTYYALVTAIEYSIEYDFTACGVQGVAFKDGITPADSYIVTDTVTLPVADDIEVPDGYKFTGWYYNSALTDGPVSEFTGKVPSTGTVLTLYARVIPVDEYTVYFRLELDDTQNYAIPTVRENESLGDRMPEDPEKEGFIFAGWYIDGKFTDETKKFDGSTVITGDTYVYAKWDNQLYTVRFIQGAAELKRIENIPYNTKLDDASYWSALPEPPKETIYMKLSSYSDFVYYDDTPFQVADVYYYQKDDGEWARFDETVAVTKNIDAYLMDKRFSMTVKIPSRSTPFGPDTPYVPGETRMMDSLKSILENGSEVLNILQDTDTFKKAENKLTQQLIDKEIIVKHANGDLEIKITEVPVNITRFVSADRVRAVIKQYITDMVNDPAKLDSMLNMVDIDTLVNQIGTSTLVSKLSDAKIVEMMKKPENRTTVINGVYSALGNESMQSVIVSYLTERIENDEDFRNTIAEEFKAELASDPTLRAEILGDTTLLNSVLGQANMKALVADVILGDDVLQIAVSDPTFKSTLIEKMAGNALVREKVSQTTLFTSYVLTKIKTDNTLKDKIREKLATDGALRETIITNSDLLNMFLDDSTLKSTIISSAVDNDVFISKIISNDSLKEIIINNMSGNQDFVELLLHTDAFADFIVTALHTTGSPFKTHILELLEEDSVKNDMHDIIKANEGFRAELASDELKSQVMDSIDEYISHGNIDDLVAYIWHRTLGDAYTGGREADYKNFITDELVEDFKDILYDHRPDKAVGWIEFFDYLTSNADARDDVKASADADVRAKINTELTQYKEDVLADFIDDGVITNPDGTENLDIEYKIDDAILEIIKQYIITETTGNTDADAHIEHEMVEYTKKIVMTEPDALHQDIVIHIEHIKEDFKESIIDIDEDILVQSIIDFRDDSQDNKTILIGVINDNFVSITDYIKQNVVGDDELKGT